MQCTSVDTWWPAHRLRDSSMRFQACICHGARGWGCRYTTFSGWIYLHTCLTPAFHLRALRHEKYLGNMLWRGYYLKYSCINANYTLNSTWRGLGHRCLIMPPPFFIHRSDNSQYTHQVLTSSIDQPHSFIKASLFAKNNPFVYKYKQLTMIRYVFNLIH